MTRPPRDLPKILSRRRTRISPWMEIIEREVEFKTGAKPELYHALGQQDYLAVVARTPDGRIPIVRQYRPALEAYTWELPAGLVDPGERASVACARELKEETGLVARKVHMRSVTTHRVRRGCQTGCIRFLSRPKRRPARRASPASKCD